MKFARVAIPDAGATLTYRVPLEMGLGRGDVVLVHVREKTYTGLVLGEDDPFPGARPIYGKTGIKIPEGLVALSEWIAIYYLSPIHEAARLILPPGMPKKERIEIRMRRDPPLVKPRGRVQRELLAYLWERRGRWLSLDWLYRKFGQPGRGFLERLIEEGACQVRSKMPEARTEEGERFVEEGGDVFFPEKPTSQQRRVLRSLREVLKKKEFRVALLHGETGSGKTAVYAWLAREALMRGKSAIILVPEISLTPQLAAVFRKALGKRIGVYHSAFSPSERMWVWRQAEAGDIRVVLGPRSALFLPVRDLGLIVVDEEHDDSYKSQRLPHYHARDVATVRAKAEGALLVLGSATPSAESYYNAKRGKYLYLRMPERVPAYTEPVVRIIDLKETEVSGVFSVPLLDALRETISSGYQAILFLNRRGYAPYIQCLRCGIVLDCPFCSISYTFHKDTGVLVCHLCGRTARVPTLCPSCGSPSLVPMRYGVQRVQENLEALLPGVRILRLDRDISRRREGPEGVFRDFASGNAKVLVGTQLVTKGLDFPGVKLVGVLIADMGLFRPDFRASERTFQLLSQVTGRLRTGGMVMIQAVNPEEGAIRFAKLKDYEGFMAQELAERKRYGYPPFSKLVLVEAKGKDRAKVIQFLEGLAMQTASWLGGKGLILGPSPSPYERVGGLFRARFLIKTKKGLSPELDFLAGYQTPSGIELRVDVDPVDMM
ncbi:MAG: primosomal protein N' [candidate division WOR-3 bacterium]